MISVIGIVIVVKENTLILILQLFVTFVTSKPESALTKAADLVSAATRVTGSSIRWVGTLWARRSLPMVGTSTVMTGAAPTEVSATFIGMISWCRARLVASIACSRCYVVWEMTLARTIFPVTMSTVVMATILLPSSFVNSAVGGIMLVILVMVRL